jgi:tetratricopeptide (TPR) repeat protein
MSRAGEEPMSLAMSFLRIASLLMVVCGAAACGDDRAALSRGCQDPTDARRQVDACTRLIALDQKHRKAYDNRCQAYNQLGQYDKALADCDMAIKLTPSTASPYNNRGVTHEMRGDFDAALKDYDQAVALDPKFAGALANRGDVYSKKGDKQRAIAEYRAALALEPDNGVALDGLQKLGARP